MRRKKKNGQDHEIRPKRKSIKFIVKKNLQIQYGLVSLFLIVITSISVMWVMQWYYQKSYPGVSIPQSGLFNLIILGMILLDGFMAFLMTTYFSHNVAGPVHRIEKTLVDYLENGKAKKIVLRKNDLLKETADIVNEVISKG